MKTEQTYKAKEIAEMTGKSKRAVEIRAKKEVWPFIEETGNGRGGKTRKYPVGVLPSDIVSAIQSKAEPIADYTISKMEKLTGSDAFDTACMIFAILGGAYVISKALWTIFLG